MIITNNQARSDHNYTIVARSKLKLSNKLFEATTVKRDSEVCVPSNVFDVMNMHSPGSPPHSDMIGWYKP